MYTGITETTYGVHMSRYHPDNTESQERAQDDSFIAWAMHEAQAYGEEYRTLDDMGVDIRVHTDIDAAHAQMELDQARQDEYDFHESGQYDIMMCPDRQAYFEQEQEQLRAVFIDFTKPEPLPELPQWKIKTDRLTKLLESK
jgi:hypothetical protein